MNEASAALRDDRWRGAQHVVARLRFTLLIGAVVLAIALSTNSQGQVATQQPATVWDVQFENP